LRYWDRLKPGIIAVAVRLAERTKVHGLLYCVVVLSPEHCLLYYVQHLEEQQPNTPIVRYRELVENG
jgi:hypothetical protein